MTHPDPIDNPHAGVFPDLSVDDSGNVLTGRDADGNAVLVHIAPGHGIAMPAEDDEGGEQPSHSQTEQGGTALSTSSSTAGKPDSSTGSSSPKPAPGAENPSESGQTTRSIASSTTGDGTEPQTGRTQLSDPADK